MPAGEESSTRQRLRKPSLKVRESSEMIVNEPKSNAKRKLTTQKASLVQTVQSEDSDETEDEPQPRRKTAKEKIARKWVKTDLQVNQPDPNERLNLANQYTTTSSSPSNLFELFFDDGVVEMLC